VTNLAALTDALGFASCAANRAEEAGCLGDVREALMEADVAGAIAFGPDSPEAAALSLILSAIGDAAQAGVA
jgi:hypothetical protein